ncbi:MAG: polymer-forming cytoskeletal protein [Sandaracinaceae bacterium]|nr:polymer-forming cytoskeletal protein [Sandaracinaceae bacterium]
MSQPQDLTGLGEIQALLGRGTAFEGTLAFEGRVRIDGRFAGKVFSEGILILGDGAEVEAEIEVGTLIVRGGTLRGNVVARQLIEIHAEGAVHGDITAPQIDIDKGCVFEGKCTMAKPPEPAPTSSSELLTVSSSSEFPLSGD